MPPKIVSLSLDEQVLDEAKMRATRLGYRSFSAYCEKVLRDDLEVGGHHVLREEPAQYKVAGRPPAPAALAAVADAVAEHEARKIVSYRKRGARGQGK